MLFAKLLVFATRNARSVVFNPRLASVEPSWWFFCKL